MAITMLIVAIAVGCGGRSGVGTVTGRVTLNGKPLRGVEVRFNPDAPGRNSVGYTNEDGEYELQYTLDEQGALVGKHNVSVTDRSGKTTIPAEFSNLDFEVKAGSNRYDIEIPGN